MKSINKVIYPLISFLATIVLTIISSYIIKLDDKGSFLVFATGTSISLAMALIEQKLGSDLTEFKKNIIDELREYLDLYRIIKNINDEQLEKEVVSLARNLASGEVPPHLASVRIPNLYRSSLTRVYASNVCKNKDDVLKWLKNTRFRQIIELSKERSKIGVKFVRTFVLEKDQICDASGIWDAECHDVMCYQMDAGIEVRIIWKEDLNLDSVMPTRRLDRNFTIFDEVEAVDTTDVQVIYRKPAKRLQEIIDVSTEQIKYSSAFDRAAEKRTNHN